MNIGLYCEPINSALLNYRGLYRDNGIIELTEEDNYHLTSAIECFLSTSMEGHFWEYTDQNKEHLFALYSILRTQKWAGEMILFTDCCNAIVPSDFVLLGYDICADSKYYSPIGDGFLQTYDNDATFFLEMSIDEFNHYKKNINGAGLFNTYSIALEFSNYCNVINNKYEHAVETENNWRPFAIYKLKE